MSMAEKFIKVCTRNCSNKLYDNLSQDYEPWLTPDQARKAVEIAREEMWNDICEWIEENICEYFDGENIMFSVTHLENIDVFEQEKFINDLKQAMKDE